MKRCLNCMEEYAEHRARCPGCDYCEGENSTNLSALKAGSILQSRYIVGTHRMIREYDITYIGWDALFERKVLILEFCWQDHLEGANEALPPVDVVMYDVYSDSLNQFYHYYRNLIHLYNEKDIISVLSCFRENQTAYAIFEYVTGVTLAEWLQDSTDKDGGEAVYFLYQAIEAVKKIHTLGLVHGDIRLDSFFVTGTRELVLKQFAQPNVCHGEFKRWENPEPGPWIDVYGLSMLFGKILLRREDVSRRDVLKLLSSDEFDFPARIVSAIEKGINITGEQRIESLDDFFGRIFGDSATMRLFKRNHFKPHNQRRKVRKLICVGIVAAFCLLLILVVALGGNGKEQIEVTLSTVRDEDPGDEDPGDEDPGDGNPGDENPGGTGMEKTNAEDAAAGADAETSTIAETETEAEQTVSVKAAPSTETTIPKEKNPKGIAESAKPVEIPESPESPGSSESPVSMEVEAETSTAAHTPTSTSIGPGVTNVEAVKPLEIPPEIPPPQSNFNDSILNVDPTVKDEDTVPLGDLGSHD